MGNAIAQQVLHRVWQQRPCQCMSIHMPCRWVAGGGHANILAESSTHENYLRMTTLVACAARPGTGCSHGCTLTGSAKCKTCKPQARASIYNRKNKHKRMLSRWPTNNVHGITISTKTMLVVVMHEEAAEVVAILGTDAISCGIDPNSILAMSMQIDASLSWCCMVVHMLWMDFACLQLQESLASWPSTYNVCIGCMATTILVRNSSSMRMSCSSCVYI